MFSFPFINSSIHSFIKNTYELGVCFCQKQNLGSISQVIDYNNLQMLIKWLIKLTHTIVIVTHKSEE